MSITRRQLLIGLTTCSVVAIVARLPYITMPWGNGTPPIFYADFVQDKYFIRGEEVSYREMFSWDRQSRLSEQGLYLWDPGNLVVAD